MTMHLCKIRYQLSHSTLVGFLATLAKKRCMKVVWGWSFMCAWKLTMSMANHLCHGVVSDDPLKACTNLFTYVKVVICTHAANECLNSLYGFATWVASTRGKHWGKLSSVRIWYFDIHRVAFATKSKCLSKQSCKWPNSTKSTHNRMWTNVFKIALLASPGYVRETAEMGPKFVVGLEFNACLNLL